MASGKKQGKDTAVSLYFERRPLSSAWVLKYFAENPCTSSSQKDCPPLRQGASRVVEQILIGELLRNRRFHETQAKSGKTWHNSDMRTVALRMLADGMMALERIAEYVGLPLDEVKKLQTGQST